MHSFQYLHDKQLIRMHITVYEKRQLTFASPMKKTFFVLNLRRNKDTKQVLSYVVQGNDLKQ